MSSVCLGFLKQNFPACIKAYHELDIRPNPEQEWREQLQLWMFLPTKIIQNLYDHNLKTLPYAFENKM